MGFVGERVLVKSAMNPITGYGRDGIALTQALLNAGADVHLEPLSVGVPLPEEVAWLFAKPRPDHFEYAIVHLDPKQIEVFQGLAKITNKVVAWSMWEFTSMASEPWATDVSGQLEYCDALIAYDEVSREAFSPYIAEDRLYVLQGGYDADMWKPAPADITRDDSDVFKFGMVGALTQRKNPFASINAFNALKEEHGEDFNAELHLKNIVPTLHPMIEQAMPGVKIHYANWTVKQLKQFYGSINCLLAPSWGEGKNLPALEAQTMGVPVIASKFGGHMQWADKDWCYLVDGSLAEHSTGQKSIRVDENELKDLMWHVYTNRVEATNKGELASKIIPQMCDWSKVVDRLSNLLKDVTPKPR